MPKATLISPVSKQGIQLIRVAAYCRVSSSSADQLNSYATQIDYYTKLAKKKKAEWNMVEIFADEGADTFFLFHAFPFPYTVMAEANVIIRSWENSSRLTSPE